MNDWSVSCGSVSRLRSKAGAAGSRWEARLGASKRRRPSSEAARDPDVKAVIGTELLDLRHFQAHFRLVVREDGLTHRFSEIVIHPIWVLVVLQVEIEHDDSKAARAL